MHTDFHVSIIYNNSETQNPQTFNKKELGYVVMM